jgi:hypothetical protein
MAEEVSAFDRTELRQVYKAFTLLGDEAKAEARQSSNNLATYLQRQIATSASTRIKGQQAINRIVSGSKVSKTSTTGEIKYGFASQRFSGGANTQMLWGGFEFGSSIRQRKDGTVRRLNQFPNYSGRFGNGSRGWFIYPTLRKEQRNIVSQWTAAFNKILDKWGISGI